MNRFLRTLMLVLAGCVWGLTAQAQLSTATLYGTVTDSTGAAVPGATVTVTQIDTQTTRTVKTENDGAYRADFLPVGSYKVSVSSQGFRTLERTGITLTVTEQAHVDLQLSAGGESQTVEVTADVPLLNTGNSTLGRTVSNVEIDNLPLVDRNVYRLLDLTPGVQNNNAAGTGGNGGVINPLGFPEQHVKINGSSDSGVGQVAYYLDGGSNMTGVRNTGNPLPNPDAIREFRVDTNNFSAQFGRNSAGVVTVLTKSGTNQFHGSAFEFFRDRNFNATQRNQNQKTPYNQHRFGGTVGGPILKDKLFFFGSYAGFRFISDNIFNPTLPSAAMLQGNFSENTPIGTAPADSAKCAATAQSSTRFWACNPYLPKASAWCNFQGHANVCDPSTVRSLDQRHDQEGSLPDLERQRRFRRQLPGPAVQPLSPEDRRATLQGRLPDDGEAAPHPQLLPHVGRLRREPLRQQRSQLGDP